MNNSEFSEAIIAENEALKVDKTNKTRTLVRCTEALQNVRDQMRAQKTEKEEMEKAGDNDLNNEKIKRKHEEETTLKKDKLRRVEKEKRVLAKSTAELKEQINELKNKMSAKHERATIMLRESNKKIMNLKD